MRLTVSRMSTSSSAMRMRPVPCRGLEAGTGTCASCSRAAGSRTRKVVPRPTALVQVTNPPCCRTMLKTTARPRPVPARSGLVVKNGSKTRSTTSGGMPLPESVTATATHGPAAPPGGAAGSAGTTSVRMRRTPPSGIASRALMHRFIST